MDLSSNNTELWHGIVQFGIISTGILLSNVFRRKFPFVRKGLIPTAVIAGFLFLFLKSIGVLKLDAELIEAMTYHGIAIGFIALSLRIPNKINNSEKLTASKSGALIVSTYLLQAIIGLIAILIITYTFMPDLFKASGLLLPMGYGQGPGQANNVGTTYEQLGFVGGQSFGLSLAAAGYACACIIGVIYLNIAARRKKIKRSQYIEGTETLNSDSFQDNGEIPISESVDRFTVQVALVLMVYALTYLLIWGITSLLESISPALAKEVSSLFWGFNFIFGSLLAIIVRVIFKTFGKVKLMTRQYQNNYLLSRISGFAFDLMIVAGIASIDISELSGLWLPFIVLAVLGGFLTLFYLQKLCKKIYPDYYYEGLLSMYGMLTGTISSGVLLLREIDPKLESPAANNLISGSSYGILMGAPLLLIIGMAPKSDTHLFISIGIMIVYLAILLTFIYLAKPQKGN
ncbi:MAG: hypothetical protein A2Y15_06495 [Clostridiales bacterium GWF2_36_10]|nr:MAG: hypothetical protein A2Y15_06495 [Clostridiales bacterium GWF2_36_10]HAN20641.1 sodium:glutamate symporter [Clostridiales bacterium]